MENQSGEELLKAYDALKNGDVDRAKQLLEDAMEPDFENKEIKFAYWCCAFWGDFISNIKNLRNSEEEPSPDELREGGLSLLKMWDSYRTALEREDRERTSVQRAVYATQTCVFKLALGCFEDYLKNGEPTGDDLCDAHRRIGLCRKKLGEYEDALNHLMKANEITSSNPLILAEMADCYALCGDEKKAKVLFREAFFIDAQKIEMVFLESELIRCLIKRVKEKGYTGNALLEWIPVYGVLFGVFNVKRELKQSEVGRLKQDIYAKENELKNPSNGKQTIVPKLINMYFWLIDHYSRSNDSLANDEIKNCLLQIRVHDEDVYRMYTN